MVKILKETYFWSASGNGINRSGYLRKVLTKVGILGDHLDQLVCPKNIFGSSEWLRIQKPKIKFKTRIKLQLSFKRGARMSIFLNHYST